MLFYKALCNSLYLCVCVFVLKTFLNNVQYTENAKVGLLGIIEIPHLFCRTAKSPCFSKQLGLNKRIFPLAFPPPQTLII